MVVCYHPSTHSDTQVPVSTKQRNSLVCQISHGGKQDQHAHCHCAQGTLIFRSLQAALIEETIGLQCQS